MRIIYSVFVSYIHGILYTYTRHSFSMYNKCFGVRVLNRVQYTPSRFGNNSFRAAHFLQYILYIQTCVHIIICTSIFIGHPENERKKKFVTKNPSNPASGRSEPTLISLRILYDPLRILVFPKFRSIIFSE